MALTDDLTRRAAESGVTLTRLSAGTERYGPVDAQVFGPNGTVAVHVDPTGGYDVAAWDGGGHLAAWGHTSSLDDVLVTMRRCENGHAPVGRLVG